MPFPSGQVFSYSECLAGREWCDPSAASRVTLARRRGEELARSPGAESPCLPPYPGVVQLGLVTVVASAYDPAISFFVDALGFELVEDSHALTNDKRPKGWVGRPPDGVTGLLLAPSRRRRARPRRSAKRYQAPQRSRSGSMRHRRGLATRLPVRGGGSTGGRGPDPRAAACPARGSRTA